MPSTDEKPTLHLVEDPSDVDQLAQLFKALTGREPTAQEMEEARAELEGD